MKIEKALFGSMPDGRNVEAYTISNKSGARVRILDLGGIINELWMPDRTGKLADIVCGYDSVDGYLRSPGYQGAIIGRYGNRIGGAKFSINGNTYSLFVNSGKNDSLHGGREGFNKKIWAVSPFLREDEAGLILQYTSPDGEEGYPGKLSVKVTYTFTENNRFIINYEAQTDKDTVVNLTNHTYYNLNGYGGNSVMDQYMWINSNYYNAVDENLIPVGAPAPVTGTEFDFRSEKKISIPFDNNFVLNRNGMIRRSASVYDSESGRTLTLYTNMPAVQLYTASFMNGDISFKGGVPQRPLHAVCLETQFSPNTPNRRDFPSCLLRPGEMYDFTTYFDFGVRN